MVVNLEQLISLNPIVLVTGNPLEREHIKKTLSDLGYNLGGINPDDNLPEGTLALENHLSFMETLAPLDFLKAQSDLQSRYFSNLEDGNRLILVETAESFVLHPDIARMIKLYTLPRPTGQEISALYLENGLEATDKTIGYGRGLTTPELDIAIHQAKSSQLKGNDFWQHIDQFRKEKLSLLGLTYKSVPVRQEIGGLDLILKEIPVIKYCISEEGKARGIPWPKGTLMIGIPGAGKSFMTHIFAAEMGWPLITISIDKLIVGGVGLLKKELESIEALSPCILLLDEMDKLLGKNGDPLILGFFLNWLQEHTSKVYTIGACNWLSNIPAELIRDDRFGKKFGVTFPSENSRLEVLRIYLSRYDSRYEDFSSLPEDELRLMAENSTNFVPAELKQMVNTLAATLGMEGKNTIDVSDVLQALKNHSTMYKRNPDPIDEMLREIKELCDPSESESCKYITSREIDICG